MVESISTILCQVTDMDRAVAFYRDMLELTPGAVSPYWSDFMVGGVRIGLHPPLDHRSMEGAGGWILGLRVDDVKALRAKLEAAGVACAPYHDIPGGTIMDFDDPDGNPIKASQMGVSGKDLEG